MSLSWKPLLRGPIYCSPACGAGCTKTAHDQAQRKARILLGKLKGKGWRIRVHENIGWHFSVENDRISVWESDGKYRALLRPHYTHFGRANFRNRNPNIVVRQVIQEAEASVLEEMKIVGEAKNLAL